MTFCQKIHSLGQSLLHFLFLVASPLELTAVAQMYLPFLAVQALCWFPLNMNGNMQGRPFIARHGGGVVVKGVLVTFLSKRIIVFPVIRNVTVESLW